MCVVVVSVSGRDWFVVASLTAQIIGFALLAFQKKSLTDFDSDDEDDYTYSSTTVALAMRACVINRTVCLCVYPDIERGDKKKPKKEEKKYGKSAALREKFLENRSSQLVFVVVGCRL